jgi:hypothetical protein
MKHCLLVLTAAFFATSFSTIVLAQPITNQPDRQGDYYSNEAPVKGKAPRLLMAGSLWRVVVVNLNCRRNFGTTHAIVRRFKHGDVLQAEVYRGGSDEVLRNSIDRSGNPWMPVRGKTMNDRCYVRANQRYIQPLKLK